MSQRLYVRSVNDKTGGRGQLSSPRALPGVPAPSRRVRRDSYITARSLARTTTLECTLSQELPPSRVWLLPVRGKLCICVEVCQRLDFRGSRPFRLRLFLEVDERGVCRCGRYVVRRFRPLHLPFFHRLRQGAGPFGRLCAPGCGSVWPDWVLSESRKKGWVSPERRDSPLRLL